VNARTKVEIARAARFRSRRGDRKSVLAGVNGGRVEAPGTLADVVPAHLRVGLAHRPGVAEEVTLAGARSITQCWGMPAQA
jgi:hypothetical protein